MASLTDLSNRGYIDVSEVPQSILASGSFEGDLYALTIGVNARAIFYNLDVMEEAGVSWSARPTYRELMEHSAQIFDVTGVRGDTPALIGPLQMMARNVGELIYDVDANGNNIIGASEETVLNHFRQIYDTIITPWSLTVEQRQDAIGVGLEADHLPTGRSWLMFPGGSNQLAAVQAATDARLGITFFPGIDHGATHEHMYLRPSQFFSIAATSRHQEEAARVICHFTNSEGAQLHLMAERGVPVNPRMADFIRPHLDPVQQVIFEYIARVTEIATPVDPPQPNGAAEVNRLLEDLTDMIRFGMISYTEATNRFIPEANAILAVHQDD
jgi:multiple sugar transport system substrate-binding protein